MRPGRALRVIRQAAFALLIAVAVAAGMQALVSFGLLRDLELEGYDRLLRWRGHAPLPPADVALLWITEADIQRHGHPMTDARLADVLTRLAALEPRVIGLDVYRDRPVAPGAAELRRVLTEHDHLVLVEKLAAPDQPGVAAPGYLPARRVGFSDVPLDRDGVVRRTFLMMWDEAGPHLSFSLLVALRYLAAEGVTLRPAPGNPELVRLGPTTLPALTPDFGGYVGMDAGGYQVMLDQRRALADVAQFTLDDLFADRIPAAALRDRAVLLATASSSVKDLFHTSYQLSVFGGALHALGVDQFLRFARGVSAPLGSFAGWQKVLWLLSCCLAGSAAGMAIRSPLLTAVAGLGGLAAVTGVAALALANGHWLTLAAPALGWTAALGLGVALRTRQEHIEKDQMLELFGRFVSARIVSEVWAHREEFMDGARPRPQRATISVLHCDLSGFVSASASLPPDQVMGWVGEFMEQMAALVEGHGGVVSDFTGDGLMASFGVPLVRHDQAAIREDATNAVQCALAMSRRLAQLNPQWQAAGLPVARLRIGVCTGEAVVGAYGSRERLKYASVGTTVNAAARLQAFDKEGFHAEGRGNRILVGAATWALQNRPVAGQCLGSVQLRGLPEPITIYRVLEEHSEHAGPSSQAGDLRSLSVVGDRGGV